MKNPWDQKYGQPGFAYGTEPNDFLKENAAAIPQGRVLFLADGEGRNSVFLAGLGYQVTAMDSSPVGQEKARALAAERGVEIEPELADLADYHIEPGAWQGIVCIFNHMPPPMRQRIHAQCVEGLVPGGVLLLEAYRPEQLELRTGGPPVEELLFTLAMVQEDCAALELKVARETERDIVEGRLHRGRGAVVQVLAMKEDQPGG